MHILLKHPCIQWLGHAFWVDNRWIPKDILCGDLASAKQPAERPHLCFRPLGYQWWELPQVSFLLRQNHVCCDGKKLSWQTRVCRDKTCFVTANTSVCYNKTFAVTKLCLSQYLLQQKFCHTKFCQKFCHNKSFVLTNMFCNNICHNKSFVTTKICLSQQKFCRDKHTKPDKSFVVTNMILVAAPTNDTKST